MHYKRRLASYNLTFYYVKNGDAACYVWNEIIVEQGANEVGSCVLNFSHTYILMALKNLSDNYLRSIFNSDNCDGQNKNKFITSLYFYLFFAVLALNTQSIRNEFLIVRQTQNEGGFLHSVIEKQKSKSIEKLYSCTMLNTYKHLSSQLNNTVNHMT